MEEITAFYGKLIENLSKISVGCVMMILTEQLHNNMSQPALFVQDWLFT